MLDAAILEPFHAHLTQLLPTLTDHDTDELTQLILDIFQHTSSDAEALQQCEAQLAPYLHDHLSVFLEEMGTWLQALRTATAQQEQQEQQLQQQQQDQEQQSPSAADDDQNAQDDERRTPKRGREEVFDDDIVDTEQDRRRTDRNTQESTAHSDNSNTTKRPRYEEGAGRTGGVKKVCFSFQQTGQCRHGTRCRYEHIARVPAANGASLLQPSTNHAARVGTTSTSPSGFITTRFPLQSTAQPPLAAQTMTLQSGLTIQTPSLPPSMSVPVNPAQSNMPLTRTQPPLPQQPQSLLAPHLHPVNGVPVNQMPYHMQQPPAMNMQLGFAHPQLPPQYNMTNGSINPANPPVYPSHPYVPQMQALVLQSSFPTSSPGAYDTDYAGKQSKSVTSDAVSLTESRPTRASMQTSQQLQPPQQQHSHHHHVVRKHVSHPTQTEEKEETPDSDYQHNQQQEQPQHSSSRDIEEKVRSEQNQDVLHSADERAEEYRGRGRGRAGTRGRGGARGRGRGAGGATRYTEDGTASSTPSSENTLLIKHIPNEHHSLSALSAHFSQFGNVLGIHILPNNTATIQYAHLHEAQAAYDHPKAVLDNRFITVEWGKRSDDKHQTSISQQQQQQQTPVITTPRSAVEVAREIAALSASQVLANPVQAPAAPAQPRSALEVAQKLKEAQQQRKAAHVLTKATRAASTPVVPLSATAVAKSIQLAALKQKLLDKQQAAQQQSQRNAENNPPETKQQEMMSIENETGGGLQDGLTALILPQPAE